jgi:hypothetical protein
LDFTHWAIIFIGLFAVVFTILAAVLASKGQEKLKAMSTVPTITAHEAAAAARPGGGTTVELHGTAATAEPLISPVTGTRCVYYHHKISELQESTSSYVDSRGYQRTETTSEWRTIKDESNYVPFMLRDSSGTILVLAKEAELIGEESESRVDSHHKQSEWVIPAGEPVYVLGDAVLTSDGPTVQKGPGGPFIVSAKSEKELSGSLRSKSVAWGVAGLIALLAGAGAIAYSTINHTRPLRGDGVAAALILAAVIVFAAIAYGAYSLVPRYQGVIMRGTPVDDDPWKVAPMGMPGETVQSLSPITTSTVCPNCNMPVAPGMVICPGCGFKMRRVGSAGVAPAATRPVTVAAASPATIASVPAAPSEEVPVSPAPVETGTRAAVIQRDIIIGGAVAFKAGERVQVEVESPDPRRPDYKYVVLSKTLNKRFRLCDLDVFL